MAEQMILFPGHTEKELDQKVSTFFAMWKANPSTDNLKALHNAITARMALELEQTT